jgi:predicted ATPase/DNA-binding CsgD family transcriptional regulator
MADRTGEQLGNYRLLRLLGRGGFAEVYLGEHVYLATQTALKILQMSLHGEHVEMFTREARTLASLNHPHIIRVLDYSVEQGVPFLVMEYAAKGSLRQRYPLEERLPVDLVIRYTRQIASALQYAHDRRLIHRDVKPENFLLGSNDELLLSDFGLAVLSSLPALPDSQHAQSTQSMNVEPAGTITYAAPEQLRGQAQPTSDQYSLGVVVYEWLCGKRPFEGTPFEMAMQHISAPPPALRELAPGISPAMEESVMRALAKAPEDRFASVQDFAAALERAYLYVMLPSSSFAPAREAPAVRPELRPQPMWKVPTTFTQLIGRDQETSDICALLKRPDVRLVTLLGTGGIGKTRLSFRVARAMQPHFADGVCFVHLATVSEADLVIPSIAQELGIQEIGGQPVLEAIKVSLSNKDFLLLLDNFEQVVATAPLIEELLAACPHLKVVVTSRATLNLDAEQLYHVPPLAFPSDLKTLTQGESLAQYAAITLFVQRAQAIAPFELTQANAKSIAEICKRLDGIPLAIELAAARMKILSPESLLAKLDEPLKTLTSQSRTLPLRHQTLRNAIQWSYDLLDAREQRLFRRLSVFLGGLHIEAVEAMQQAFNDVDNIPVLDRLASLLDKSLLIRSQIVGEEPHIQMLRTMREYALDLLQESGEFEQARRAHAMHYLSLVEEADKHLKDPQQIHWLALLQSEQENLRGALAWCMEHIEQSEAEDAALRLCGASGWFWFLRGYWSEARRWLDGVLGATRSTGATAARAKALYVSGMLAYHQDDYAQARPLLEESLQIFDRLAMKLEYAYALGTLGQITYLQGELDRALSMLKECETLCRSLDDRWGLVLAKRRLGYVMLGENDLAQAAVYTQEALALARQLGDKYLLAILLLTQGDIAASQSDLAQAIALDQEGQVFARELGNKSLIALAMQNLGYLAGLQGNLAQATVRTQEALKIMRDLGDKTSMTAALHTLGYLAAQRNDLAEASACYQEGLSIAHDIGNKQHIGLHLIGLAGVALAQAQPRRAARLFGSAESVLDIEAELNTDERAAYERGIEQARGILGEEAFAALHVEGRDLSPAEALAASEQALPTRAAARPRALPSKAAYPDGLTHREVEILRLLATGHTVAQMAGRLVISARTVTTHISTIYRKIGVNSRSDATRYAIAHKLVN